MRSTPTPSAHLASSRANAGAEALAHLRELLKLSAPGESVSLNVYWLLALPRGAPHRETAWRFLLHTLSAPMDHLTTTSGAICCRRSTWHDPEINNRIPFYNRMEELHQVAREIPRRPDWPAIASIIDRLVTQTINTANPTRELL